jgi:tetratricopeptide (TPR) repeat protein
MMQHYPNRHFTIANSRFRLARTLVSRKKFAEAKRLANDVIQVQTKNLGKNDEHVIRGIALLANIHRLDGDPLAAESFAREAVSRAESGGNDVSGQDRLGIRALTLRRLAIVLQEHKVEEAVEVWKQAIMYRHLTWGDHPQVASSMLQRAKLLDKLDRFEESSSCCGEAVAMLERLGDSEKMLSAACLQYSEVLRKTGQGDLADDFLQKSLRLQAGDQ